MGHAYSWLGQKDRNSIKSIFIYYAKKQIQVGLDSPKKDIPNFVYEDVGGMTCVRFGKKDDLLEKNFVDAFCADLHLLLTNQKLTLNSFFLVYQSDGDPNQEALDTMIAKIFKTMKRSFASRQSPFPVNNITLEPSQMSHGVSVLKYLDPSKLESFHLSFVQRRKQIHFERLPFDWNKDFNAKFSLSLSMHNGQDWLYSDTLPFLFPIFHSIQVFFDLHQRSFLIGVMANNEATFKHGKIILNSKCVEFIRNGPIQQTVDANNAESTVGKVPEKKLPKGNADKHIKNYQISLGSYWSAHVIDNYSQIEMTVDTTSGAHKTTRYHKKRVPGEEEFENDRELCPQALKEIEANLKHREMYIEHFQVIYQYFYEASPSAHWIKIPSDKFSLGLEEILRRSKQNLKVRKLSLGMENQAEVMRILPYLDKNCLKIIELLYPAKQSEALFSLAPEHLFEIQEISKTEQWKSAKQFISKYVIITTLLPEMNITHFVNTEILVLTLSSDDVFYLKNTLLDSPTFRKFKITFKTSTIDDTLHNLIGEPYRTIPGVEKIWFFPMSILDYYLHVVLDTHNLLDRKGNPKPKVLVMTTVEKEDIPFG